MEKQFIKNDLIQIEYLPNSLRIVGLTYKGSRNLLADLSSQPPIPTPYGDFFFRGGHRLWHSPEAMPRTYAPDTGDLKITRSTNSVLLETQTEPGTGIRKQIEVRLQPNSACATLTHTLINDGMWPVELAPWAITQFRLGGKVILPLPVDNADPSGLLPNRQLSFWPYTRLNDPRLKLSDTYIIFHADSLPPFKIGYFNPHGWIAYQLDGITFRKTIPVTPNSVHPDNNSNVELYCNHDFVELESLAPLGVLQPGASVSHIETWELFEENAVPDEIQQALKL